MNKAILFNFLVDKENKRITVERSFAAPLALVWSAWTQAEILDQWWAPKPWRAETKAMQAADGGRWQYCMVSPEGERHWCIFDYERVEAQQYFSGRDAFCDENAHINPEMPSTFWHNTFAADGGSTLVRVELRFDSLEHLETLLEMGFQGGFTMGLGNLDAYLAAVQSNS